MLTASSGAVIRPHPQSSTHSTHERDLLVPCQHTAAAELQPAGCFAAQRLRADPQILVLLRVLNSRVVQGLHQTSQP